ncbi:MAG: signal peptidase I [Acholeplasmataceae bacterium]|nr:signal peptidase I [Acholeplasmataceae bacterium]
MLKKIIAYTLSIITIIFFVLTLLLILLGIKANQEKNIVTIFGYSYSVVATDSMEDTIMVGEILTIKSVPFSEVDRGEIIVFWSGAKQAYIVHRVIDKQGDKLITKGDNPAAPIDADPVTENNYHGVVIKHRNFLNLGKIMLEYRSLVYGLIIFLFFYIIVSEIINIIRNLKKAKQEELQKQLELSRQKIYEEEKAKLREQILEEMKKE